ncbi:MAG: hypothetical protein EOP88_12445 [Verrucomicrobiaceae bacterium]|nr:MAG: hypothetical protein EOP88_12445 [Verrucomicrobiaceae bacterium]
MLKRTLIVLSVAVLGTAAIWLMPGQTTVETLPLLADSSGSSNSSGKPEVVARRESAGVDALESAVVEVVEAEEKVPQSQRHAAGEIEKHRARELPLKELKKAVRDQEMKVEEKRKILATIVRTKGIIYKGRDSTIVPPGDAPAADPNAEEVPDDPQHRAEMAKKDAEERGRDAMAYVDAKQDFETDQELLKEMQRVLEREREKLKNERP